MTKEERALTVTGFSPSLTVSPGPTALPVIVGITPYEALGLSDSTYPAFDSATLPLSLRSLSPFTLPRSFLHGHRVVA